jgi:hypothetical protein
MLFWKEIRKFGVGEIERVKEVDSLENKTHVKRAFHYYFREKRRKGRDNPRAWAWKAMTSPSASGADPWIREWQRVIGPVPAGAECSGRS